jgi:hypothetical protein
MSIPFVCKIYQLWIMIKALLFSWYPCDQLISGVSISEAPVEKLTGWKLHALEARLW